MKYEFETKAKIGDTLYYLNIKEKKLYAPCPVCNNTRKIKITTTPDNQTYEIDCPRCSNLKTKGVNGGTILKYSIENIVIDSIKIEKEKIFFNGWIDIYSLCRTDYFGNHTSQYYLTVQEAEIECKRLNSLETIKKSEILKGYENDANK